MSFKAVVNSFITIMHALLYSLLALGYVEATWGQTYSPAPRWGSAYATWGNFLLVHGGKTNPSNQYTYNSGLVVNDLLSLDLSQSFAASAPPWSYISGQENSSTSQGPAVSFHTMSPFSSSSILLFGGDGGPSMPLSSEPNSAWLLDTSDLTRPNWTEEPLAWASQPVRRMYHTATASETSIWITGGEMVDGSGLLSDAYRFDTSVSFHNIPLSLPPLFGHVAVTLSNGLIIVCGGEGQSGLISLSSVYLLNTTLSPPAWTTTSVGGSIPSSRRSFVAVVIEDDQVLIHGGIGDGGNTPESFLADGYILDTRQQPMQWRNLGELTELGSRADHIAVTQGSQILFVFGWGPSGVMNSSIFIYDTSSNSFTNTWSGSPIPSATAAGTSNPYTIVSASTDGFPGNTVVAGSSVVDTTSTALPSISHPSGSNPINSVNQHSLTIALASVFGILALVAVSGGVTYVSIKRKEEKSSGAFYMMQEDKEDLNMDNTSPHFGASPEKVQERRSQWQKPKNVARELLSLVSNGGRQRPKGRVDMLADEDNGRFESEPFYATSLSSHLERRRPTGPSRDLSWNSFGSSVSHWYGASGPRKSWSDVVGQSLNGLTTSMGGKLSQTHPSGNSLPSAAPRREQSVVSLDPFGDDIALRGETSLKGDNGDGSLAMNNVSGIAAVGVGKAARPRGGTNDSATYPYNNPMDNRGMLAGILRVSKEDEKLEPTMYQPDTFGKGAALSTELPNNSSGESQASHEYLPGRAHTSSIIGSTPILSVRRSDSWWSRLGRGSLRDRHFSPPQSPGQSSSEGLIDFRDPNPAPKLLPIEEASQSLPDSAGSDSGIEDKNVLKTYRRRSLSSTATIRTADTIAMEQLVDRMDVIQRATTASSELSSSTVDDSRSQFIPPVSHLDTPQSAVVDNSPGSDDGDEEVAQGHSIKEDAPSARGAVSYRFAPRASLYVANPDNLRNQSIFS